MTQWIVKLLTNYNPTIYPIPRENNKEVDMGTKVQGHILINEATVMENIMKEIGNTKSMTISQKNYQTQVKSKNTSKEHISHILEPNS
jgi:hypothetical protein